MPPSDGDDSRDLDDVSPHVRIRINPAKKQRWLEYADEHDLSLTDLIKDAVDNTISDTWVLANETNSESPDLSNLDLDLGELDEDVQEVLSRLDSLQTQLDDITLAETGATNAEPLPRQQLLVLANQCHDKLPQVTDGEHLIEISSMISGIENSEVPMLTGTAYDIAEAIDESEHHVRQALMFLENEQNANVTSIIHEGVRRWYEVDARADTGDILDEIQTEHAVEFQTADDLNTS